LHKRIIISLKQYFSPNIDPDVEVILVNGKLGVRTNNLPRGFMMRFVCFIGVMFFANTCYADVVVYNNSVNSASLTQIGNTSGRTRGQTWTNTDSVARHMVSVTLYLANPLRTTGNMYISVRAVTGTPGSTGKFTGAELSKSSVINANTIGSSMSAVTFTGFNDYSFAANINYAFTVNIQGTNGGDLNLYFGSEVANQNSYYTAPLTPDPTTDLAGEVVLTPEPGTFLLFGTAIAIGGVGVYMKRRKQKPALV